MRVECDEGPSAAGDLVRAAGVPGRLDEGVRGVPIGGGGQGASAGSGAESVPLKP